MGLRAVIGGRERRALSGLARRAVIGGSQRGAVAGGCGVRGTVAGEAVQRQAEGVATVHLPIAVQAQ